jgi:shikimate 5-dehydrogenase/3-dehydroquinate dehydratase
MKLVVTIHEPTPDRTIEAIRAIGAHHDMVEVRVDTPGGVGAGFSRHRPAEAALYTALRAATAKPMIVTNRGGAPVDFAAAYGAGIEFVDVEFGHDPGPRRDRVVLSHHDFQSVPDLDALAREMRAAGCAHTKIAVTPQTFADNARVLATIAPGMTLIGMGGRGLYSRILAPFFGSELLFVGNAAPGQFGLERALEIYGDARAGGPARPHHIFAIAGNPASHSGSPAIHNRRFRERGVAAAYTIFESDDFLDIAEPFVRGERFAPTGISVTAPFKEEALTFAARIEAAIAPNAAEARAVNTLVRTPRGIVADNTDVDGFEALMAKTTARRAAVLGAGATARAALVALRRAGIEATVFNRTAGKLNAKPLDDFTRRDGELVINTLPVYRHDADVNAAYGEQTMANDGRALLEAQAIRQNELFVQACRGETSR